MLGLLYFDVLMILPVGERLALRTHYMFHTFTGNISKYEVTILRQIRHFSSTTNLAGLEWNLNGVVFSKVTKKYTWFCNLGTVGSLVLGCLSVMNCYDFFFCHNIVAKTSRKRRENVAKRRASSFNL